MRNLLRLYRSPEGGEGAATIDSVIDDVVVDRAADKPADAPADKLADKPAEPTAWDKTTERRKRFSGEERRADAKDPIYDMGYETEKEVGGKKVKEMVKAKLSEIREAAKFYHDNRDVVKLGLGLANQFKQAPAFAKLFDTIQAKMFKDGKIDETFVTSTIDKLEAKQEQIQQKVDDQTDDIKEMQKDLEDLDPDSPQAKILKRNISALQATRTQLKQAMDSNKQLQDKIGGIEKFNTDRTNADKTAKTQAEEDSAIKLFDDTYKSITSKDTKDAYHIEDAEEAQDFEDKVRRSVQRLALEGKIKNDQEFTSAIRESAKVAFEKYNQRNERVINSYLKTKKPAETPVGGEGQKPITKGKSAESMIDDLVDSVDLQKK